MMTAAMAAASPVTPPAGMASSSSSSWVKPFLLGAASSLSMLWLSQQILEGTGGGRGRRGVVDVANAITSHVRQWIIQWIPPSIMSRRISNDITTNNNNENDADEDGDGGLMDRPDLDQRMLRKAEAVIRWRTTRLILVIERCTNDHNYSAILRSCEALGIQTVFIIDPPVIMDDGDGEDGDVNGDDEKPAKTKTGQTQQQQQQIKRTPQELEERRLHHLFAQNATSWLTIRNFETSEECVAEIRCQKYQLWVTDLSQEAVPLGMSTPAVPDKVALVMGTEAVGASQYILDQADKRVYLPLRGFADSLNLSVATALILHHIFLMEPSLIGSMDEAERLELRRDWYTKLCQQRILTTSQKRQRARLISQCQKCQKIQDRIDSSNSQYNIQKEERKRLDQWPTYKKELDELNALIDPKRVQAAIQEWVDNPPEPLTDLRRADVHRVCFVGKTTKEMHKGNTYGSDILVWYVCYVTRNFVQYSLMLQIHDVVLTCVTHSYRTLEGHGCYVEFCFFRGCNSNDFSRKSERSFERRTIRCCWIK
jgi:tRNA G18 (ribose-2'-O)-methylase SpoU